MRERMKKGIATVMKQEILCMAAGLETTPAAIITFFPKVNILNMH